MYTHLNPTFIIAKLGYTGVYLIFLFLLQNIDCEYWVMNRDMQNSECDNGES